ncbi:hypothetical protein [Bacillus sp. V2I10]|uniref:hypothetical protein n=1 Tax=Bacillus sp. V2I10 TaxID=3042276 RepID=UPI0027D78233|nr:hypothetical protein [Bacillus sp. V2I10]
MLTFEQQMKLKELLNQLQDHPNAKSKEIDVSHRLRDEKGRFLPNESSEIKEELPSRLDRPRKVIKIQGSYNSYLIKDQWFTDGEIDALIVFGILGVLAIIL